VRPFVRLEEHEAVVSTRRSRTSDMSSSAKVPLPSAVIERPGPSGTALRVKRKRSQEQKSIGLAPGDPGGEVTVAEVNC
jgi:hypothetical protein